MLGSLEYVLTCALVVLMFINNSSAIDCYQCSGTNSSVPFQCNEWLDDVDIKPEPCDNVYGAKYCIKHLGRFEASAIKCYQCSSSNNINCADGLIHMGGLQPQSCDHVFEAQYCIKSTSLDGGIGAKRYCSSLDLGNYCNFVKQPGDTLNYRTCVFTCSSDGCNPGTMLRPQNTITFITAILLLKFVYRFFVEK